MNEDETRAEYIDPALKAAGWGVVESSRILREYPFTLGRIEGHGKLAGALGIGKPHPGGPNLHACPRANPNLRESRRVSGRRDSVLEQAGAKAGGP